MKGLQKCLLPLKRKKAGSFLILPLHRFAMVEYLLLLHLPAPHTRKTQQACAEEQKG